MAPLAVHCVLTSYYRGGAPDGKWGVNWGQNVFEIKQISSELKEKEGRDSEQEELKLIKSNQGFKKVKCQLLMGQNCG